MKNARIGRTVTLALAILLPVGAASAHTRLIAPNGGEQLEVGSVFQVQWTIVISHTLLNWDLWYSTDSSTGPWTEIAMDLPPGPMEVGSEHTYDWTIPDAVDDSVWVRVRMDNSGTDYEDVSDQPFAIVSPPCPADFDGSGDVGFSDLLAVLSAWGPCEGDCPQDLDGSGDVGFGDIVMLLGMWGPCA